MGLNPGSGTHFPLEEEMATHSSVILVDYGLIQFSTVAQSCPTLWSPMDCSILGFSVHQQLPSLLKLMSIELVMPSTISSSIIPLYSCLQSCPASGSFQMSQFFAPGDYSIGVSASASVLPMNIQD